MKLPDDCPFEKAPPEQCFGTEPHRSDCCRARSGYFSDATPLCRFRAMESEAYRFLWRSSFSGAAFVHIAQRGDGIGLSSCVLGRSRLSRAEPVVSAALSLEDWEMLQGALRVSDFWSLDSTDERIGLDGACWLIEARRGDTYHWVDRWCPQGAVYDLGRLFFALAGPALADFRLY